MAWQLSIVPTQSAAVEVITYNNASDIKPISDNPLYLPYKLSSYVGAQISGSMRIIRAISIIFFGLSVMALYRILKRWHSDKVALFASMLFATNATALSIGRLGAPYVMLFTWSIIISLLLWLQHGSSRRVAPFTLACVCAALFYVPGAPYFFVLLMLLFGRKIKSLFSNMTKTAFYVSIVAVIAVMTPLIITFTQDIEILKQWLFIPETIDLASIPRNVLRVPSAFIYRAPIDPVVTIGRLPILDVATGGLFLLGLYAYQKHIKLERTKIMLLTALLSIIIGSLGQVMIAIILVLPFVYAVVAAGISYLLEQWYAIFPKNPFARSFGLLIISIVVMASSYYQLTRFLVVWPQTPETRAVYDQPRLVQ
ncbi:MAG: hypothetical protein ACI9T8_000564 [Candidatus Saccharimonadales bacterium]|jgi:hypothetical protein